MNSCKNILKTRFEGKRGRKNVLMHSATDKIDYKIQFGSASSAFFARFDKCLKFT